MRLFFPAGLIVWLLVLAACGGSDGDVTAVNPASPVPIQDKTWSTPYGLALDGETSQIAFNASGPVVMAWWHLDATRPTDASPATYSCTLRTRGWLKTGGWGPVDTLLAPSSSDSYQCGGVDVHANSAGDVLVVANPVSPLPATLFRRLTGEADWRQPATPMSAGAGLRSMIVARIAEGGEVRQVDFRYVAGLGREAWDSYRYATRLWERSGAVQGTRTVDVSYQDPVQGYLPIYGPAVSIDPQGNVLVVVDVANQLRWSSFRADADAWSMPAEVAAPGESAGRTPRADWYRAFRLSSDPLDGKPWLLTMGTPPDATAPIEVLARRFDPEAGWSAGQLMVAGDLAWGWDPGALATLADGRTMLVYLDAANTSGKGLLERTWTPGAGWSSPRSITRGPYGGYDARVAIGTAGDAVVAFRDCANVPRIPLYDGAPSGCVVKVSRLRDFASRASVWTAPEVLSITTDPPGATTRDEYRIGVRDLRFLASGDVSLAWWRSATFSSDWELWLQTLSGAH